MNLQIQKDQRGDSVVLTLTGEVDFYTSPRLKQELVNEANAGRTQQIVDVTGLDYLDNTGLGVLIAGVKRARERGGSLTVVCENIRILRIFHITGLDKIFRIERSVDAALASPVPA